jgi:uncharacterized protein (TIGR02001 family)
MRAQLCCGSRGRAVAPAGRSCRRRHSGCSRRRSLLVAALLPVSATGFATAASAQIAGSLDVQNDYRVRGYSISEGRPAAILNLSYDTPGGLYLNGAAIGSFTDRHDPALIGAIADIGYAYRLTPRLSIDGGVNRTEYFDASATGKAHYTEFYLGILAHGLSSHIYISPDYYHSGVVTLYAELDGALKPVAGFHVTGHIGVLNYLGTPERLSYLSRQYDWRLGLSHPIGPFDLHAALTGGGPGDDYYRNHRHGKTALVAGVSWIF